MTTSHMTPSQLINALQDIQSNPFSWASAGVPTRDGRRNAGKLIRHLPAEFRGQWARVFNTFVL